MKIALLTDAYQPIVSGVTTSILMLKEGLEALGHQVYVITTSAKGAKEYDKTEKGIIRLKGIPFPKKGLKHFRYIPFVRGHLKKIINLDLDVIHIHTEFSLGSLGKRVKDKTDLPLVFTVHTMYEEYFSYLSKLLNRFFKRPFKKGVKKLMNSFIRRAEVTITPSLKTKALMESYQLQGNYRIIPTGIDLENFYQSSYSKTEVANLKASLNLKDEFVCLFVGRISEEKSIDVIVKGFKKVSHLKMKLLIVGDGPYMSTLKALVKKLNLESDVIFTGMIKWEDVGLYYQIGDLFLNASLSETQGLTYIEALAAGLPVIVKYDQVLEDVVKDYENGIFFYQNEELPALIEKVYQDKTLREKLTKNALLSVTQYSKENYALNVLKAYQEASALSQND
ncbi:MAG: glycosyltransferase family 4 protein [Acholeplasmatales bacterium]|jgi:1,2-diacylglycerol 3-alpha-glucosyltransferase|nr:glycosyltransferase family 4 protein [Acholeplasmataceae bacterium]MCK9233973.1 glycosyltransferase family 4 protein [Acholeplasmataceae bacterium]MCK9289437.1 glycosyltransferase family 4 protein [Acholeplasmataceae bacterium]MCK9427844.1 glycosyltransferase family 4 protein [Acholeplasmataceae bacterium]MDY0115225.1 glycosyltransferase family 4 protein [Acholeplasmatales bacterium]